MRGFVQGEIFDGPFGRFRHGPCHRGRFGPKFLDFGGKGWSFRGHPGFGPWMHHGCRGHHGHHGFPEFHDYHGFHSHHKHHRGHHHRRSESPECYGDCGPRPGSPGPRDSSPCCRRQRGEESSPEKRGPCGKSSCCRRQIGEDSGPERRGPFERSNCCNRQRGEDSSDERTEPCKRSSRMGKRCFKGGNRGGPWRRRSFDCLRPGPYDKPACCKKCCRGKRNEESGNECDKTNDVAGNRNENTNNEALIYERVVVENSPRGPSD